MMEIKLNPALDAGKLAQEFTANKRIQIRDFLVPEAAEQIYKTMVEDTQWLVGFRDEGKDYLKTERDLQALGQENLNALHARVLKGAREDDFGFIYCCYPLMDERLKATNPGLFLYKVVDFINSAPLIDFIKTVTAKADLVRADAQATWYRRQQFLTLHNDYEPVDTGKRVAYVLSFAKDWKPDWGGFLQFYDEDGNISQGFMPRFNTISMFATPQNHSVSYVTPLSASRRMAITGWFRNT